MVSLKLNRPISISWLPRRQRDRRPRFCRQTLPPRFVHSKLLAEKVGVIFEISLFSKTREWNFVVKFTELSLLDLTFHFQRA